MAFDAKVSFLNQLEKRLSEEIPAAHMARVLSSASDLLESYEMQEHLNLDRDQDDLLDCYLSALKVEGKSQKTIDHYRYVIGRMLTGVGVPVRRVTVYHLRGYLANEQERGISDATLRDARSDICAFYNWLQRESLIEKNPTANLGPIKCAKKVKRTYSAVDIEKLEDGCKDTVFRYDVRNRAIVDFLKATGCRVSEVTGLNRDEVDLNSLECVVRGKGNKERTVYLDPVTGMKLRQYLESRTDDNEALFLNQRGGRLQPGGIRAMLKRLEDEAQVDHVHPHKFRRTLATNLNRHGMPIQEVANILGHEKLDTTMQYVVLNKDDVKNSYKRYY